MADYPDSMLPTATSLVADDIGIAKDTTLQEKLDIKTSELRDGIRGSGNQTLTDLESDLSNILAQLDITLSQLRDSLKGTGSKTLTDLESDLSNILGQLDITLSQVKSEIKGVNDKSMSDLYSNLSSILAQLDITFSQLRDDVRGSGDKTLTDLESDLSGILGQLDIKTSEIKAVNTQTPRTLSEIYDELSSILGQLDITLSQFRDAIRGSGSKTISDLDTDLGSILGQLDITISQLRDALLGTGSKTLTDVASELEKTTAMDLISNGEVSFADTDDLTTEKKTSAIQLPSDSYPGRIYYLAIEKPTENTAGDLTINVYNLVKIDGTNEREVLHSIHTVEKITDNPTYRGFLIQGLGFGEGKVKLGFKFASDSGAITVKWALFK